MKHGPLTVSTPPPINTAATGLGTDTCSFFDLAGKTFDGFSMIAGERSELCGRVLDGRYRIGSRIGLGGTGVVFEASCLCDGTAVAIKALRPRFVTYPDLGRRLRREAEVASRVSPPGIVPIIDEGTLFDGSPYIVMPRMYGESLARLLVRLGALEPDEVATIAINVASILHRAHAAGYTHRDVKPEHVLLNRTAAGELAVHLLDFGVCASAAVPVWEQKLEQGKVFGTPAYVSPEQAGGNPDVDGRADLFSLGVVMFEALSGRLPFTGSRVSKLLLRILNHDAPRVSSLVPTIDPKLDQITARLLARNPNERFRSGRAVARALRPHAGDRRNTERRVAAMLDASSHISDTAPTLRCRILPTPAEAA